MEKHEFRKFLYNQIPMTEAMEIDVEELSPTLVKVSAKLEPNKNHKSTAFGGSINSLMTVCGWSMVFTNIKHIDPDAHIVIQRSNVEYLAPVAEDFVAECSLESEEVRNSFVENYKRRGKSRLKLTVSCYCRDKLCAKFEGDYVAFK